MRGASRYLVALASVALAGLVRALLDPLLGSAHPFAPFYLAVTVAAWFGGLGPGLLATALGFIAADWFFVQSRESFAIAQLTLEPMVHTGTFVTVGCAIAAITSSMRATGQRADRALREREHAERQRDVLFAAERAARAEAETVHRRVAFLAEASVALSATLDIEATLAEVTRLAVPVMADWCSADVVAADGTVQRVAIRHADPSKAEIARSAAVYPADPEGRHPRTRVLRTGEPVFIPDVSPESLAQITDDADHLRKLRSLGYRSAMIVPLTARGQILGALTFATTVESERRYGQGDLAFAQELARRAALALDNARLFAAERQARAEAEDANRTKDEFLTTVSHELRTPLQAMLGWVAVLRQGKLNEARTARAIEIIERSGRTQARLIGDLLDVSRIVTGRLRLELRAVDPVPVARAALDAVRPAADAKRVALEARLDADIGEVAGDPDRLQQIVWNLLSNGVKFTPSGGRVELRLAADGQQVRLEVTDTGEGIAPDFLPHVFERFRQAEGATSTRRAGGIGLGLAIVRHLVELHGGRVEAASPGLGQGAQFTVVLPRLPRRAVEPHAETEEGLDAAGEEHSARRGRPRRS